MAYRLLVLIVCFILVVMTTTQVSSVSICLMKKEVLNASSGIIKSRNFPSFYRGNTTKVWKIVAPKDEKIILQFQIFKLDSHSPHCEIHCGCDDYLKVRNKCNDLTPLHYFCGPIYAPLIVISAEDELWVEFRSDHSANSLKLLALYTFESKSCPLPSDNQANSDYCLGNDMNTVECCNRKYPRCTYDELMTDFKGTISSPGFGLWYSPNAKYRWRITIPQGYVVQLNFTTFETEYCNDTVTVSDGPCNYFPGRTYCGAYQRANMPSYISTGRHMFVEFKSDFSLNFNIGFQANYRKAVRCTNDSKPVSCIKDGAPSCCYPFETAVICKDSRALYRSHCKSGEVCCIMDRKPICCESDDAAVTCTDSFVNQRSHCKSEEVCCIQYGEPRCCDRDDAAVTCTDSFVNQRSHCKLEKVCCVKNGKPRCCDTDEAAVTCADSFAKQRSHCKSGKVCCIENGHHDCCDDTSMACTDVGSIQRSHCPKNKNCCVVESKPTCCSSVKDLKPWSLVIIMICALLVMVQYPNESTLD